MTRLVETEARLDREIEEARRAAAASIEAARQRARDAGRALEDELGRERARIGRELADATAAQLRAIADDARAELARYDAVRGASVDQLVRRLALRLVAIATGEDAP